MTSLSMWCAKRIVWFFCKAQSACPQGQDMVLYDFIIIIKIYLAKQHVNYIMCKERDVPDWNTCGEDID